MRKSIRKKSDKNDIFPAATVSPLDADGVLRSVHQEKKFDMRKILTLAMVTVLIGCATRQNLKGAEHFTIVAGRIVHRENIDDGGKSCSEWPCALVVAVDDMGRSGDNGVV
jgi:hypothetical protein